MSPLLIALIAVAAVAVLGAVAGLLARRRLLTSALPRTRGTLLAHGVSAPVNVMRDRAGIAHVDARSMEDAAFAMGLVHAQDRLWQMEMSRRVVMGRVSEFAGAEGIEVDRFIRRLGLIRVAREEALRASAEVRGMLDAYAAGVNRGIDSARRLPIEFRLLKLSPDPWEPAHSIGVVKLLALGLSTNWDAEQQRLDVLRALGPERAAQLDPAYPEANPTILGGTVRPAGRAATPSAMFAEAARWIPTAGGASNSWVVSGARTATGRPILCNDPHLTPTIPSIWYAAHVRAGDDFESIGATMPGMPFVVIGHNRRCAWGFTNSFADCQDLVIEEFDSPAAERCRTERGFEPTRLVREVIHVRGASDEIEEVVSTRHGPVVEHVDDQVRNVWRGLALQWTALAPGATAEALLRLQRAGDWPTFRAAFEGMDAPSQNVVYADVDGHIGYLLCGRVPVRRRAPSGLPVPGWSGDALWTRYLTPSEMPAVLDPPEQSIITANNRVVGAGFPHYISSDYMNGYRAARLAALLDADRMQAAFMNDVQMDLLCPPAAQAIALLRPLSCASPTAEHARRALVDWDGVMRPSQMEPTLYEAFMQCLAERALKPYCGPAWRVVAGVGLSHPVFGYPGNIVGRVTPELLRRWEADDVTTLGGATWADTVDGALEDGWNELRRRYGRSTRRWRWGRVHRIALAHPFGRRRLLGLVFNGGHVSVGGSMDTVMATSFVPGQPFGTRLFAPSWRQIIDVGDWDSCTGIHLPGQSGQPGSRHYRDLRARWRRNRQVPLHWSWDRVRRNSRAGLRIVPAGQVRGREGA